ncbi:hypothetical protein I4U23_011825 [Adineta vaga]|nr:hypothetical protein I4U23_011825 [Adineta vaga]
MNSYDYTNHVLITDDVDSQCVDMLVANGFSVEKDIRLAKQPQKELIKRVQAQQLVMNTPGGNTLSAAEHTCASLKLGAYWLQSTFMSEELNGKTLAIIGLGRIGREVAKRMQSFNTKFLISTPFVVTRLEEIQEQCMVLSRKEKIICLRIKDAESEVSQKNSNGDEKNILNNEGTPGGNTLSAAEHTCASLKSGVWQRSTFMGEELNGKTLAIIGLGRIGREVAKRMQSFNMKTIGYDPIITAEQTDYITVHVSLMQRTHHLINKEVLSQCRKGVKLINVARGGAALDVFEEEPPVDLKLVQHPGVICTPHLGANTREVQKRVAIELAQQIIDFKQGHSLIGVVNGSAVTSQFGQGNRPILLLSKRLGQIIGASSSSTPKHISLSYN